MNIHILAGGPDEHLPNLAEYDGEGTIWVGVDRGMSTLIKRGITPDIAFGDFDSVTEEELAEMNENVKTIQTFNPEKDEPDIELALNWALQEKPHHIRIFGATGGRLDHFFANVHLLLKTAANNCLIEIIDKQNILTAKTPGTYEIRKNEKRKYISFLPISSEIANLTLVGFKYPLRNHHIPMYSTLCISNELIADYGTFSFTTGILLVIRSSD